MSGYLEKLRERVRLRRQSPSSDWVSDPVATYEDALVYYDAPRRTPKKRPRARRVVMLALAALRIDPRIEREARALAAKGFEVVIVGPDVSSPLHSELPIDWGPGVTFDLQPIDTASFYTAPPYFVASAMRDAAIKHDAFAIHANDIWTSFAAMEIAEHTGALIVSDYHEWGSENVTWDTDINAWAPHKPDRAQSYRELECVTLRRADLRITVNDTIARSLEDMAEIPPHSIAVIRNIPRLNLEPTKPYPPLKAQLGLPEDCIAILYQGGTGPSRLLEPMIESLAHLPEKVRLIIRGPSLDLFGEGYRAVAAKAGVESRLMLCNAIPSRDVVAAARGADIGIYTVNPICNNFKLALPNKVFEYLAADLPLAVADFPESARIPKNWKCGEAFDPYSAPDIAAAISRMLDPAVRREYTKNAAIALSDLNASREWETFADLYEGLWSQALATPIAEEIAPLRVLHSPCNVGNQPWTLSRAERKLGLKSDLVVNYSTWLGYPADLVLGKLQTTDTHELAMRRAWGYSAPLYYDVLHCYFGRSLLFWDDLPNLNDNPFGDLRAAKRMGKPVFMTLQGCDVRLASESNARNAHTMCAKDRCGAYQTCVDSLDEGRRFMIREALPLCDRVFFLNPELGHTTPKGDFLPYANVDIHSFWPRPPSTTGKPRIVHAPSDPLIKGTDDILAALSKLSQKHDFELMLVKGVTHAEAMKVYESADIAIDQILAGWYGGFAVELMAMGKPVACYLREEDFRFVPKAMIDDLPIIRVHPSTLEADLDLMLQRRAEWPEWSRRSRYFVEKWHDPDRIACWMAKQYRSPQLRAEFNPDDKI